MGVDYRHKSYVAMHDRWTRARDCVSGSDAVKSKKNVYLPMIDIHVKFPQLYDSYLQRAVFYNMTGRTVEGLAGAICQKTPEFDVPTEIEPDLKDITNSGVSAESFVLTTIQETLIGRFGILLEMSAKGGPDEHPYWCGYQAEQITNWLTTTEDGAEILTMVVLKQTVQVKDPSDKTGFSMIDQEQFLVLELIDGKYTQTIWVKQANSGPKGLAVYVAQASTVPLCRDQPLDFIPFVFVNPTSTTADVQKPPLDDLVIMQLAHYKNSADYEHGLHYTGIPIPWMAGAAATGRSVETGPQRIILLEKGGTFNIAQASGESLGALENAMKSKEQKCAVLGARLLEMQPMGDETATAAVLRHSGEQATLRTIAQSVEQALTKVVKWHVWWSGTGAGKPADAKGEVQLNKDFFSPRMDAVTLQALVMALQAEAISHQTFWYNLKRGEMTPPGVESDDEKKQIENEAPPEPKMPAGFIAHPATGQPILDPTKRPPAAIPADGTPPPQQPPPQQPPPPGKGKVK